MHAPPADAQEYFTVEAAGAVLVVPEGDGAARFEGSCTDPKARHVNVRLNGTYEQTSFRFRGGAQLLRGTPYIPATITARRISAQCPANAEYF